MKIVVGGWSNYPCLVYVRPKGGRVARGPAGTFNGGLKERGRRDFASIFRTPSQIPALTPQPLPLFRGHLLHQPLTVGFRFLAYPQMTHPLQMGLSLTHRAVVNFHISPRRTFLKSPFGYWVCSIEIPATTFCGISVFSSMWCLRTSFTHNYPVIFGGFWGSKSLLV